MKTKFLLLFIVVFAGSCNKESNNLNPNPSIYVEPFETEEFAFESNWNNTKGKIYLPPVYNTNSNLPSIYLIDFTEQHFAIALDEFEKVVDGVEQIDDFDALSITLKKHFDFDVDPEDFQTYYEEFSSMTSYVDDNYTDNTSRTFIGRGSEGGIVLMALFLEDSVSSVFDNFIVTGLSNRFIDTVITMIGNNDFPQNKSNKKLHFSFESDSDIGKCNQLINAINDAQYPWLQFESVYYSENIYVNAYPIAFADGLEYIFEE